MGLSDEIFNRQLEWFCQTTAQVLQSSRPEAYAPTLFLLTDSLEPHLSVIQGVPPTPEERIQWMRAFGAAFLGEHKWTPAAAFLGAEAWRSEIRQGMPMVRPSQDPDRKEIVLIAGATRDGRQNEAEISLRRTPQRNRLLPGKAVLRYYQPGGQQIQEPLLAAFFEGCEASRDDAV